MSSVVRMFRPNRPPSPESPCPIRSAIYIARHNTVAYPTPSLSDINGLSANFTSQAMQILVITMNYNTVN